MHFPEDEVSPLDIIFSCSVCGDTLTKVYDGHTTETQGFSDGINERERIVSRLYVSACCHVICIKHIEGGAGPAFSPHGTRPQAVCPTCTKETGESRSCELYSVRGFKVGEYDPAIPEFWFKAPPIKLDGEDKEMEALRFQYLALMRFGKKMASAQASSEDQSRIRSLEKDLEKLQPLEQEVQKLHRFQARLPAIEHYLGLLPKLTEQNDLMRRRLATLGFHMVLDPIPNYNHLLPSDFEGYHTFTPEVQHMQDFSNTPNGQIKAQMDDTVLAQRGEDVGNLGPHRPFKRQRLGSPDPQSDRQSPRRLLSSRGMMPPPSRPKAAFGSLRKLVPHLRQKLTSSRTTTDMSAHYVTPSRSEMCPLVNCVTKAVTPMPLNQSANSPICLNPPRSGAFAMDGSNHTLQQPDTPMTPKLSGSKGGNGLFNPPGNFNPNRGFAAALPSQPSYIQLMNDLSYESGLDLSLRDPRLPHNAQNLPDDTLATSSKYDEAKERQSLAPNMTLSSYAHLDFPVENHIRGHVGNGNAMPATSAFRSSQQHVDATDPIVSLYFRSSESLIQPLSRSAIAEVEDSLEHLSTYRSSQRPMRAYENSDKEHSLIRLSLMDTPLDRNTEPIPRRHYRQSTYPKQHDLRNDSTTRYYGHPDYSRFDLDDLPFQRNINRDNNPESLHPRSAIRQPGGISQVSKYQ